MKRLLRLVVSLLVLCGLVVGTITLVRLANGDFAGDYQLQGTFPKAGEGLNPGSAVVFRGVQVGRVSTISLSENQAEVSVLIQPSFKVPATATATIEPVNLFGAEQVAISTPHGNAEAGPYLAPGGSFAHAQSSDELGDLFAAATPLLNAVDDNNLATVLGELSQASQGEGPKIAASISAGTQLAGLLDRTLNAQILALDSFAKFATATAPAAADFNNMNHEINAGLPAFNAEESDYENLLNTLIPFSNRLASLLATYHPDIATILSAGDNVSRVLLAQQDEIGQVVNGAYHYFQKIAEGASSPNRLPDGSTYAYFNTFVLFSDVNSLVCNLIAPPTGGMSFLQPIQQALAGAGSAFNCSSQLATFNALQASSPQSTPAVVPTSSSSASSPTAAANSAAGAAANQAYGAIGQPDTSQPGSLGGLLNTLLGGG
jgi:phospholipid/cholesterol/gamma-HCH transport system substrate-binding protein